MKKLLIIIASLAMSIAANAFEFDSINLNEPYYKVSQEIAKRGYIYNHERNCLQGDCHGVKLFLAFNYIDVSRPGMLGQLIVEVPMEGGMLEPITRILNVLYHQIPGENEEVTYSVDPDGTKLSIREKEGYIILTYSTPYYSPKKK